MNTFLLYIASVIFSINQTNITTLDTTRIYKFEYTSSTSEKLTDYIQLVFQKDSVVKGKYYGNEDDFHFSADIKFDKYIQNDNFSFSLVNYRFCDKDSNPFQEVNYFELKELPFNLKEGANFSGIISEKQLVLQRTFWFYDSRFDKMTFVLVKEN